MGIASPDRVKRSVHPEPAESEPAAGVDPALLRALFALTLLVVGTVSASICVGIWLGWAAGGATLSVVVAIVGFRLATE